MPIKKSIAQASKKYYIFCPDHRENRQHWLILVWSATHLYRHHALSLSFKSFGIVMVLTQTVYLASFKTKIVFLGDLPYIKDSKCPVRNMSRPQRIFFKRGKAAIFLY